MSGSAGGCEKEWILTGSDFYSWFVPDCSINFAQFISSYYLPIDLFRQFL